MAACMLVCAQPQQYLMMMHATICMHVYMQRWLRCRRASKRQQQLQFRAARARLLRQQSRVIMHVSKRAAGGARLPATGWRRGWLPHALHY